MHCASVKNRSEAVYLIVKMQRWSFVIVNKTHDDGGVYRNDLHPWFRELARMCLNHLTSDGCKRYHGGAAPRFGDFYSLTDGGAPLLGPTNSDRPGSLALYRWNILTQVGYRSFFRDMPSLRGCSS